MRQHVFEQEHQTAREAHACLTGTTPPGPAEYEALLKAYEHLLRQSEKIVRIGDSTQNKLLRAQKMLHRAIQRYKTTAEQKSELLSIVTHELKNKAAPIRELSRWVYEEVEKLASPRALEMLRHIQDAADKMAQSVNSTLTRESTRSSEIVPVFEWSDLSRLAARIVEEQTPYAGEKGIALRLHIPSLCEAYVDEFLIGEVFENLINNAIKFSPRGGGVDIALTQDDEGIELRVRDEGPGLTDDDKARLFGKFQVLSARPTGDEKSTGMGLYIVRKLVDLHEGDVRAESEGPGKGTCFILKLPPQAESGTPMVL